MILSILAAFSVILLLIWGTLICSHGRDRGRNSSGC